MEWLASDNTYNGASTYSNFPHEKTTHHSDSAYGMYFEGTVLELNNVPSDICNKHAFVFLSCIYL